MSKTKYMSAQQISLFESAIEDIILEREAQFSKWGMQDWESHRGSSLKYLGMTSDEARSIVEFKSKAGTVTWADICLEELAEALDEQKNSQNLRNELVQVAAVVVSWIESLGK